MRIGTRAEVDPTISKGRGRNLGISTKKNQLHLGGAVVYIYHHSVPETHSLDKDEHRLALGENSLSQATQRITSCIDNFTSSVKNTRDGTILQADARSQLVAHSVN